MTIYGHQKRKQKRLNKQNKLTQFVCDICNEYWQNFYHSKRHCGEVLDSEIYQLYDQIYEKLLDEVEIGLLPKALHARFYFFNKLNRYREKSGFDKLPLPVLAYQPKRPSNTNDFSTFDYLGVIQKHIEQIHQKWLVQDKFNILETLSFLLFCLMAYAGINDPKVIYAIYQSIKKQDKIYRLPNGWLCLLVDIDSDNYGHRDNDRLVWTRLVVFDNVSLLWLSYFQQHHEGKSNFPSFKQCIQALGDLVQEKLTADNLGKSSLFKHLNIYWQALPNAHIDQQIVAVLTGKQRHTAIHSHAFVEFFAPIKLNRVLLTDDLFENLFISSKLNHSSKLRYNYHDDSIKIIRKALSFDKKIIKHNLEQLYQNSNANEQRIIKWLLKLHQDNHKVSTLRRYLSEVGADFIYLTQDEDFDQWNTDDYHWLYQSIIEQKHTDKKGYTSTVLKSLHHTLQTQFLAPKVNFYTPSDPLVVASSLIPPKLYQAMLTSIEQQDTLSDYYRQLLKIVLILLYRTGMRISEVLGLQTTDIEYDNQHFGYYALIVRPNRYRELKSDEGARRFNLSVLLKPEELSSFVQFFYERQQKQATFLFTPHYQHQPIERYSIDQPLQKILKESYAHLNLHSFRHHAISVMAMILRIDDYQLLSCFCDYDQEQIKVIKKHFLGQVRHISPNYWQALMGFAGHISLDTTFESYIHTADIIAAHQLTKATVTLPIALATKLTGKKRRSFNEHNSQAVDFDKQVVYVNTIYKLVGSTIRAINLGNQKNFTHSDLVKNATLTTQEKTSDLFGQYSKQKIIKLLEDIESGIDVTTASSPNFDYQNAYRLYQRALSLVQDKQATPIYKLIGKDRKAKSNHPLIAPTPLHYHQEQVLAQLCFDNAEMLCQSTAGKKQLQEFINVFYEKVSANKPFIRFSFKHRQAFYHYLNIAFKILPSKYWRINICQLTKANDHQSNHTTTIDKLLTQQKQEQFVKKFVDFQGEITTNTHYNGYAISVIRPNNKGKVSSSQPNSALMKYVCHVLLVVLENI